MVPTARDDGGMEPERQPEGPPDSVRAAGAALRSRRHAEMLFDAVVDLVGDEGWQETENRGATRRLFRRDPDDLTRIVPWPVLELRFGSRNIFVADWMGLGDVVPVEPPPPPPPPKIRGLGPGEIRIVDGPEYIEIAFNEEGAKFETCRSHHAHPLSGLGPALAATRGNPIELLARFVAALVPGRHGPGRALLPVAVPHGVAGVWQFGLHAMRRALFSNVSRGAHWAVADGLTGSAVAFGASCEEALSSWRGALAANPPWPKPREVEEPPEEVPEGAMLIRGPSPDVPMPERVPANVPVAIVNVEAMPASPPSFGSWVALLGARGTTSFAACRRKRNGFTLIGQGVLRAVDLDRIDGEMDRVDEEHAARMREMVGDVPGGDVRGPCRTTIYRVGDGGRLALEASSEGAAWHAGDLDGDVIAHRIVRQRWADGVAR